MPTNLKIMQHDSILNLSWEDNSINEIGFKIDKKLGDGLWQIEYAIVSPNITKYVDSASYPTQTQYYYRVYAFFENATSEYIELSYRYFINCGDPLTDYRDGKIYKTVLIGDQCWMAENINIGEQLDGDSQQTNNEEIEKHCYNDDENYCNTYGGYYQWDEIMQYMTTPGAQGICPEGWHIPQSSEWNILESFLGNNAGEQLKEIGTSHWRSPNTATNSTGFTGLPGGYMHTLGDGGYSLGEGTHGEFWTSTISNDTEKAWDRQLYYDSDYLYGGEDFRNSAKPVRCIKDKIR